jgi:hypothetical protein
MIPWIVRPRGGQHFPPKHDSYSLDFAFRKMAHLCQALA